ncbi:hypothetical protein ABZ502_17060 [Streptomyces abikoensis]|uniref:MmyB family transcriptional regulator n=1 Tax=Streptomyces abikoensis TaxID=97398 RepID=UPI00340671B9
MDTERVRQILGTARLRTDASDHPEIPRLRQAYGLSERGVGRGRRLTHLGQEEIDLLLGLEPGKCYARLERGLITAPAEDLLRRVGEILRLQDHQWNELHLALYGHRAPKPLDARPVATRNWRRVIHRVQGAAYISTFGWDVLDYNEEADALFGPMPKNIMRWMLSLPPYQHSRQRMPDWKDTWVPAALSQLRSALAEAPDHNQLRQIEAEILANTELAAVYQSYLDPFIHPDGTRRLMYHPGHQKVGAMDAAAGEPMGSPGVRLIFMEWTPRE